LTFTFMTFTTACMSSLADHLTASGTTDAALAERVRCDRSMITKIKAGKATPSLSLAVAISRETGVPIEALLPPTPSDRSAA